MNNVKQQQSGMVIILAILIIAAILTTAVLLNNIVTHEIMQSRLIDQSIQAYYYAESGSERALYQLRQREAIADCRLLDPDPNTSTATCGPKGYCINGTTIPCINVTGGSLGAWQIAPKTEKTLEVALNEGETFQVDLFGPTQVSNSKVEKINVNFDQSSVSLVGELTNLTKILNISGPEASACLLQDLPVLKSFISSPPVGITSMQGRTILGQCSYIFKVNYPVNGDGRQDSTKLTVGILNAAQQELDIPSRLTIDSKATFGDSAQTITVRTPVRPPLSGLYDFVLFSENDIVKVNQ